MNHFGRLVCVACLALAMFVVTMPPAQAALVIDLQNGVIDPGGTLTLDVLISGSPSTEQLQAFTILFDAAPNSATAGTRMEFIDPASPAFLTNPNYVFFGNSDAVDAADEAAVVALSSVNTNNDRFQGSDLTANFLNDPVVSNVLLVQLQLQHVLNGASAAATAGDTFTITLDPASDFEDEGGVPVDFNDRTATITVAALAIPEPGTIVAGIFAAVIVLPSVIRRRKQRRRAVSGD